jgi:hypothetical protein
MMVRDRTAWALGSVNTVLFAPFAVAGATSGHPVGWVLAGAMGVAMVWPVAVPLAVVRAVVRTAR